MADILVLGLPYAILVFPTILIYLKLMNFVEKRSIVDGLDVHKEKVDTSTTVILHLAHIVLD